eukprot:gene12535-12668_t
MTIQDFRALPDKLILVRHAESVGNVDANTYCNTPDYEVPLSASGWDQAVACGHSIQQLLTGEHGTNYKVFFMTSPYCRTRQTFVGIRQAFSDENFAGVQEEVQLREQDFGNFQDPQKIKADLAERNRFGRFYYRFPDGESGSDVYNRISIFEDHLIRDMKAGKFSHNTSLCLITHGLTMRVFLMRFFNWTVESFLQKISEEEFLKQTSRMHQRRQSLQVKQAYRLRKASKVSLKMCQHSTMEQIDLIGQEYLP